MADSFTWPPRNTPDSPDLSDSEAQVSNSADIGSEETAVQTLETHPTSHSHSARAEPPSLRLAFERTFLGLLSPPWPIRAADANWRPDPAHVYCPRCAAPVGPHEVAGSPSSCAGCRDTRLPWSHAVRLGPWAGPLRTAILEAKYASARRLAFDLGIQLGHTLARRLQAAGITPSETALLPIPMSFQRRWTRGLDHTLAIARGVRAVTEGEIRRPLRRRHRPAQASLPESGREANARGSFLPKSGEPLAGFAAVILLDDVRTTGATLRAACRAIQARERRLGGTLSSEQVWIATLAVVTPSNRRVQSADAREVEQDSREVDESLIA